MTDHEKRASERVPVALRIRLRYQAVDQFISKFAVNISRGGMFLSSRNPKAPGTRIDFEILLADDSPVIEGAGEVRWIREYDRRRPDQPYGMGIQFVTLSQASWPLLERVIVHRRATGVFDEDGIPEPRGLWARRDPRAAVDGRGDGAPGTSGDDDDPLASRLGTVVEGERDDPDDHLDEELDGELDGADGADDRRRPGRGTGPTVRGHDDSPSRRGETRSARDEAAHRAALDDTAPREDFSQEERRGAGNAAHRGRIDDPAHRGRIDDSAHRGRIDDHAHRGRIDDAAHRAGLDDTSPREDLAQGARRDGGGDGARRDAARGGDRELTAREEAAPGAEDLAHDTAEYGIDDVAPDGVPARGEQAASDHAALERGDDGADPDVIASVARPAGQVAPTNGARAEVGDDSPDDQLRRELMRALGPSVLMSRTQPPAPERKRTAPPTEPVVRAAMARARELTRGGYGELDRELAELLEHGAVPVEISVEAASRELAERLGGAPVQRRNPGPGPVASASASPRLGPRPPVGGAADTGEAAPEDEPTPTSARRALPPADVEPSPDSHAARLLRGK